MLTQQERYFYRLKSAVRQACQDLPGLPIKKKTELAPFELPDANPNINDDWLEKTFGKVRIAGMTDKNKVKIIGDYFYQGRFSLSWLYRENSFPGAEFFLLITGLVILISVLSGKFF